MQNNGSLSGIGADKLELRSERMPSKKKALPIPADLRHMLDRSFADGVIELGWPSEEARDEIFESIEHLSPKLDSLQKGTVMYERDDEEYSYYVFFLVLPGEQFRFTTEVEPTDFEEEEINDSDIVGESVPGTGEIGLVVGVSTLAPVAMVATSYRENFENGDYTEPDFLSPDSEYPIHPDLAAELAVLATKVVELLKAHGLRVLTTDEARQKTPWLKASPEIALDPNGEMTVFDAFFFPHLW